ncbi:MAG: isopeptide-forming domain-containing fimbrial protein [Pseudomonadota bacterium]
MRDLDIPFFRLEDRILLTAEPTATIDAPAQADLGADFQATITFDNTHPTDAGYGPYVDVILPSGIDGAATPADQSDDDGVTFNGATFLGASLVTTEIVFDAAGEALHPYAVDTAGSPVVINGTPGDTLVVIQLPFGSFTADQTPAEIVLDLTMSEDADLGQPLDIQVSSGFQYGNDPLDNPTTDPSVQQSTPSNASVEPSAFDLTKTYIGPENETATGPNFTRFYELTLDVADGQTFNNVVIEDDLPNNIVPVGYQIVAGAPTSIGFSGGTGTALNGNVFSADFGTITGSAGAEAVIRIEFYVPEFDADGARVIDPNNGDVTVVTNDARASGDHVPLDSLRDPVTPVTVDDAATDHNLDASSIVIQKSSSLSVDTGAAGLSPGDTIAYTLQVQISDYFSFNNLVLDDVLSDGQRLDTSGPSVAEFTVSERGGTTSGSFSLGVDMFASVDSPGSGQTFVDFDLSAALVGAGVDGALEGGLANGTFGGTTATITYRTIVQDAYTDQFPSGEQQVGQGDRLTNSVDVAGDVLVNGTLAPTGLTESDDSSVQLQLETGTVSKSIYAINGNTAFADLDIAAGDEVTYRLTYALPLSSVENLIVTDYLPLPVFDAGLPDQANPGLVFNDVISSAAPAAGEAHFNATDTFRAIYGSTPAVSVDTTSNAISFNYGDFDVDPEQPSQIDILFTVTVADESFADNLQLTNQVTVVEGNTFNESTSSDGIVQFTYEQAVLEVSKGVIATDRADATFSQAAGPVGFTDPGTSGFRGTATFDSDDLDTQAINADLDGIDAGDIVSFGIVVENTGTIDRGAFDVFITDTLPDGFAVPGTGLNLSVTDANGTAISYVTVGGGLFDPAGGIELVDPSATQGALASAEEGAAGTNIAFITYDLVATQTVEPDQSLTNVATVTNYASREGGVDLVPDDDLSDSATVTTTLPTVSKTLLATNHAGTSGSNVTIGEEVTFLITATIPEGTIEDVVISDIIPGGNPGNLDILSTRVASISSAITGSALSVNDTGTGTDSATFNFGDLVNTDTDNTTAEQIVIEVIARVGTDSGATADGVTEDGDTLQNRGRIQFTDAADTTRTLTNTTSVDVLEPDLNVTKSAGTPAPDADDLINYTITVAHDAGSNADAYDVALLDQLTDPDLALEVGTVSVVHSSLGDITGTAVTSGNTGGDTEVAVSVSEIAQSDTLTITFQARVDVDVVPGQAISNSVALNYDSLPASVTGSEPTDREYNETANAEVTVPAPGFTKSIASTSHAGTDDARHTAAEDLTIGEEVTYELEIELPEGQSNIVLTDVLPTGLEFVSSEITAFGGDLSSSAGLLLGSNPTTQLGQQVAYDFGTVTNTPDGDTDSGDRITVSVTARVLDAAANLDGLLKTNTASLVYDNGTLDDSAVVDIVEPDLEITKSASTAIVNGADTVTYAIMIGHSVSSDANAYDIALTDLLTDADLSLVATSVSVTHSSLGDLTSSAGIVVEGNTAGDDEVRVSLDELLLGDTVTVTFDAEIAGDVIPSQTITNTADIVYDTLPGSHPEQRSYSANDDAEVTVATPTLDKSVLSTSISATGDGEHTGGVLDLVVGETVTYTLTIGVPEGESDLVLTDNLPTTNGVLSYQSHVISTSPTSNISFATPTVTITDSALGDGLDDRIEIDFGRVVNTPDNTSDADDVITVLVTARVEDVAANVDGDTLTNTATLQYNGGSVNDTADVEIVEPELEITKTASSEAFDLGETVTYTVVVAHTSASTATAFDVAISDLVDDPDLSLVDGSVSVNHTSLGDVTATAVTTGNGSGDTTIAIDLSSLDQSDTVTVTYQAVISSTANEADNFENDVTVTYDSNPGSGPSRTGSETSVENVFAPPSIVKSVLSTDDADTGSGQFDAGIVDVSLGETVTYQISVTLPEMLNENLIVTDSTPDAPGVLDLVSGQVISIGSGMTGSLLTPGTVVTATDTDSDSYGDQIVFNFGDINNPFDGSVGADDVIVIEITGRVPIDSANTANVDIINAADLSVDLDGRSFTDSDTATVEVVEPELSISKSVDVSAANAGDTVTYTLTVSHVPTSSAVARDVVIVDALADAGLELVSGSITVTGTSGSVVTTEAPTDGFQVDISQVELGETVTITYEARILNDVILGSSLPNTADLSWDGTAGPTGRTGNDSANEGVTVDGATAISKTIVATSLAETGTSSYPIDRDALSIGETVTYHITATLSEGADTALISDQLPYLDGALGIVSTRVVSIGGNITTQFLTVGDGGLTSDAQLGDGIQDNVVFDFGNVSNLGDNIVDGRDQIVVEIVARALDVPENSAGDVLVNTGSLTTNTGTLVDTADVEIVEPEIVVKKSAENASRFVTQTQTFTVMVENSGNGPAYNVAITDTLPDGLALNAGSIKLAGATAAASLSATTNDGFTLNVSLLMPNEALTITYTADVEVTAPGGETLINTVFAEGESAPNGSGRETGDDDTAETDILVMSSQDQRQSYGSFVDDQVFQPLVSLNPFFSGTSEYAADIVVTLRDNQGAIIGSQSVLADAGGNWVAAFPLASFDTPFDRTIIENELIGNSRLFDSPHSLFHDQQATLLSDTTPERNAHVGTQLGDNPYSVEIVQDLPSYAQDIDKSFNARVYFTPVVTNEVFSHEQALDINRVFEDRADVALDTLYHASLGPLGMGGNRFTEEFLATGGSPHGY